MVHTSLSTVQVADICGVPPWKVRRLYELHDLPEPDRVGRNRVISIHEIPIVITALRCRGWLPSTEEVAT